MSFIPDVEMKPTGGSGSEQFGYQVASDDETKRQMIVDAQARFNAMNPDDVTAYAIIVMHKPGLRGATNDEENTTVEFAGSGPAKYRMLVGYLSALKEDHKARDEIANFEEPSDSQQGDAE